MQLKILRDGNRITYILARDGESIPLVSVGDGEIKVLKGRITSPEIALLLASALKHAVSMMSNIPLTEEEWRELERFWAKEYESAYVRRESSA